MKSGLCRTQNTHQVHGWLRGQRRVKSPSKCLIELAQLVNIADESLASSPNFAEERVDMN